MRGYLYDCTTNAVYLNNNKYASHNNHCVVIRNKDNLKERYGINGLIDIADKFKIELQDSWTSEDLANVLWSKFKELTDAQIRDERRAKRAARNEDTRESRGRGNPSSAPRRRRWPRTYRISFERISEELRPTKQSRLPRQAQTILDQLRSQSSESFTEDEMKQFVEDLAKRGVLVGRTRADGSVDSIKQSAWRIFSYYEATFHHAGFVKREIHREYETVE